ncbi:cytochrome c oxidase assembly protein subunit 15 [Jannaschia faecimaris]|uniref:Heme A synthase n=1 Tax=Jannaschia faecimaris TaxID=1244108 RepID=A0A1H3NVN4_9RHOB|nr:heme A synthase [Jannaschia faecimaris]SDY92914.1 cytochrome c oxidase assembly protein subunit 15 [Jannaschia faecimaris]
MAKRAIFEDVTTTDRAATTGGLIDGKRRGSRGAVKRWLVLLFVLILAIIPVGGMTRLTDSGLSITEWNLVTGTVPPMSEAAWESEFDKYRQIPEYQLQNRGMEMSEFKFIYWWEWGHRQLGRVIGAVWILGFLGLLAMRKIPPGWTGRLVVVGAGIGAQGAVGWWMVSSGLSGTMLDVASYRLATHLGGAFALLSLIAWFILSLSRSSSELISARRLSETRLMKVATVLIVLTFAQILMGALVAGIDAGRNYIDWPLMAGGITPPGMWELEPAWRNLFENDGTVQFFHRLLGYILFAVIIMAWWVGRRSANRKTAVVFVGILAMATVQMLLGVVTVMHSSPWYLAILHQFGAIILIGLTVRARHRSKYPLPQFVRT